MRTSTIKPIPPRSRYGAPPTPTVVEAVDKNPLHKQIPPRITCSKDDAPETERKREIERENRVESSSLIRAERPISKVSPRTTVEG
jgi:hypothetical protein